MGMHEANAAQPAGRFPSAWKFRNENGGRLADNDHADTALSVNDQTQLPAKKTGKGSKLPRLFYRIAADDRVAPLSQSGQCPYLTGLEPCRISFESCSDGDSLIGVLWVNGRREIPHPTDDLLQARDYTRRKEK